jgi:hypothetical protein
MQITITMQTDDINAKTKDESLAISKETTFLTVVRCAFFTMDSAVSGIG